MKTKMLALAAAAMIVAPNVAIAGDGQKELMGMLLGGAGGGFLGSKIGKGKGQLAATAAGTLLGALMGRSVGQSLDRADDIYSNQGTTTQAYPTTGQQIFSGRQPAWRNPDQNLVGRLQPTQIPVSNCPSGYTREYTTEILVGGKLVPAYGTACYQVDGSWKAGPAVPVQ